MSDDETEWDHSIADLDDTGEDERAQDDGTESGGNVAGQIGGSEDLEPGTPTGENVFFVLLGATLTLALFLMVAGVI